MDNQARHIHLEPTRSLSILRLWYVKQSTSTLSCTDSCTGTLCVFVTCYQYIIDAYESYAASALASVTFIRYMASGGMVIVGIPFYENLGVAYTLTILGCITAALVPVPYLFYKYGHWIRSKSKYAISPS